MRRTPKVTICILLLAVVGMTGCKPKVPPISDDQVIGSWTHSVELFADDAMTPSIQNAIDNIGQIALELDADHSFILTAAGGSSSGTWEAVGPQLVLSFEEVGGAIPGGADTLRFSLANGKLETVPSDSGAVWLFDQTST